MHRLLRAIEAGYNADNPYHNATHAADVLRTTHVLAHAACLTAHHVDTLGLMALYFAAVRFAYQQGCACTCQSARAVSQYGA